MLALVAANRASGYAIEPSYAPRVKLLRLVLRANVDAFSADAPQLASQTTCPLPLDLPARIRPSVGCNAWVSLLPPGLDLASKDPEILGQNIVRPGP